MQITEAFNRIKPLAHFSLRWKAITNSVCYFIAKGMHPFQRVNEPGFRQLIQSLEPRCEPSDRKTLANNYMRKMYKREKERYWIRFLPLKITTLLQIFEHLTKIIPTGQLQFITYILITFFKVIY